MTLDLSQVPQYRSRKVVRAFKIEKITECMRVVGDPIATYLVSGSHKGRQTITADWREKHQPEVGGYLVLYATSGAPVGHMSYCPGDVFERDHTYLALDSWHSTKVVHALPIAGVAWTDPIGADGYRLSLNHPAAPDPIHVTQEWYRKFEPAPGWYYVIYEDGYTSCSPAQQFVSGYDRI